MKTFLTTFAFLISICCMTMTGIILYKSTVTPPALIIGQTIPDIPAQRSVAILIRKGCQFCQLSMPFYKRLAQEVPIVFIAPDAVLTTQTELDTEGVKPIGIFTIKPASIPGIEGTPTILEIDDKGKVNKAIVGEIPTNTENQTIAELKKFMHR
jgi:hypothetical protein